MRCEAIPTNVPYSKAQKRHEKNVINPGIRSSSEKMYVKVNETQTYDSNHNFYHNTPSSQAELNTIFAGQTFLSKIQSESSFLIH